jgi:hypothetical protein
LTSRIWTFLLEVMPMHTGNVRRRLQPASRGHRRGPISAGARSTIVSIDASASAPYIGLER